MTNPVPYPTFRVVVPESDELDRIGPSCVTGYAYKKLVLSHRIFWARRGVDPRSLTRGQMTREFSVHIQFTALADVVSSIFRGGIL
ncbi:hypothetical protein LCGC14_1312000 [marine sediment metagenome]|uniref:Uncharacterized protein n=1 Tax=marine sediment metagenome TaxID=412755 RepID=A0A0F9NPI4_9ZZZZ